MNAPSSHHPQRMQTHTKSLFAFFGMGLTRVKMKKEGEVGGLRELGGVAETTEAPFVLVAQLFQAFPPAFVGGGRPAHQLGRHGHIEDRRLTKKVHDFRAHGIALLPVFFPLNTK